MWLDAFSDTTATIYTFSSCIATADLAGDGDYRLIIADIGSGNVASKLKVYKGTGLFSEITLQERPTAVCPIFIDNEFPRIPVVTSASSDYVYVYKNLKPFFRAVIPQLDINPVEREMWTQYESVDAFSETLQNLQGSVGMSALSIKSQNFLSILEHERDHFLKIHSSTILQRKNIITCVSTLKKAHEDEHALTCLVVGTENADLFVLHPETFIPIEEAKVTLADIPVFLSTSGVFDVDYTVTCSTRRGFLIIAKRGWASTLLNFPHPPCGVICLDTTIIVGLMDCTLSSYTDKGHKIWSTQIESPITCIQRVNLKQRNMDLIAVGLLNGNIIFYNISGEQIDKLSFKEPISALYYGQYGRESNSLITVTRGGSLFVKILKRSADFTPQRTAVGPVLTKFQIPKKTKLFVDQTMRERENAIAMHRAFQRDAFKMKLETARCLVKILQSKESPVLDKVKLSAEVLGLGPKFLVRISISSIGPKSGSGASAITELMLFMHWDDKYYEVTPPLIHVPMLTPGVELTFQIQVESITTQGLADTVRIMVIKQKQTSPLLVAVINMPESDTPPL